MFVYTNDDSLTKQITNNYTKVPTFVFVLFQYSIQKAQRRLFGSREQSTRDTDVILFSPDSVGMGNNVTLHNILTKYLNNSLAYQKHL